MRKILRFTLIAALILLFTPHLTSIAFGQSNDDADQPEVYIEAAAPTAAPSARFFGKTIGGVTAGDLFYVDATDSLLDISLNLYIANADELVRYLRYLILKVAVYYEDGEGQWQKMFLADDSMYQDTYLTLQNSPVTFTLPGQTKYKVAIDSGCYYCLSAVINGDNISPLFYLTVEHS